MLMGNALESRLEEMQKYARYIMTKWTATAVQFKWLEQAEVVLSHSN